MDRLLAAAWPAWAQAPGARMTVFVTHAPADRDAAEALERYVERRGHFVELDDGATVLKPLAAADVLVLLTSARFSSAGSRLRLEQRAFDAWAEGRLVLVRLDGASPPVGLRDLPAADVADGDWAPVAQAIQSALYRPLQSAVAAPKPRGFFGALVAIAALAGLGLAAGWVVAAIWLVNRIGPTPGGWPELMDGLDAFGARFGVPFGGAVVVSVAVLSLASAVVLAVRLASRRPAKQTLLALYADADRDAVAPLLDAASRSGFRVERPAPDIGPRQLMEAIKASTRVVAAISPAMSEDDRVKRVLALAARSGAVVLPVQMSPAEPPEDVLHFLAARPSVKLYESSEPERVQAFLKAIGAVQ